MALPKEPRQKMINLMYLVLTALLALNVSAEILNAFRTVNSSLQKTDVLVTASTATYMNSLKEKLAEPESAEKAKQWYPLAVKAQQIADNSYAEVKQLKDSIMFLSGFDPAKNHDSTYKEDDINTPQRVLVDGNAGKRLLATLNQFKTDMLGIDPSINKEFASTFPLDLTPPQSHNKASDSWEGAYFHMTPTIAAVTILSKFQNDIRTAENKVVEYCHKQVGQVVLRINAYAPIVALSSTYLMNGQQLNVSAGVAAFNSENQPVISIDGQSEATGADGMVEKNEVVNGVGGHSVHVHMSYKDQDGKLQTFDKDFPYTVGEPTGLSISADDVKVLYIGLDNHLTINSGNVGSEKVDVKTDNGTIIRGGSPGVWIAKPSQPGKANLVVNVDGKPTTFTMKVKSVPDPVGIVGNNKGGRMKVNEFKAQFGVGAILENFVFEGVKFNVTSYTIVCNGAGFPVLKFADVQGDSFDPIRSNIIEQTKVGTTVVIDNIRATGPGGSRQLPPIAYTLY